MTNKQLETIAALLAGTQLAVVHLSNALCQSSGINHDGLAQSFEETGAGIPESIPNRELQQMILNQIASGIRNFSAGPDYEALMQRLLR